MAIVTPATERGMGVGTDGFIGYKRVIMRVVVIGDVGVVDAMMHIGDEAMFEAAVDELQSRGADVVGVSSNAIESAQRYGIHAVSRIRFDGLDRAASERRLDEVVSAAAGRTGSPRTTRLAR